LKAVDGDGTGADDAAELVHPPWVPSDNRTLVADDSDDDEADSQDDGEAYKLAMEGVEKEYGDVFVKRRIAFLIN
jgi:hypothetical protein